MKKSGPNIIRMAGQRAALIADIAAASPRGDSPEEAEAALMRLAQEPLALFQFLNARRSPPLPRPEAAGPLAQIRSKIAAALITTVVRSKQESPGQSETEGLFDKSPDPDHLERFLPSAGDIAEALDDHLVVALPHVTVLAALVLVILVAGATTCFVFWFLH